MRNRRVVVPWPVLYLISSPHSPLRTAQPPPMSNISKVKAQLQEKEELVAALTERLELAAEQLDRLHRTGADRGPRSGGGFPAELIERQETLVDDLQRAVQQWEDMQAAALMGRLEVQITELRDLIVTEVINGGAARVPKTQIDNDSDRHEELVADQGSQTVVDEEASDQQSRWEAMKAELLGGDAKSIESEKPPVVLPPTTEEPVQNSAATDLPATEITDEPVDPPPPVNFETADAAALKTAIDIRDEYIAHLIKRLRSADSRTRLPTDWAEFDNMPAELCLQVEELQKQLEESLRLSEVEFSVERARLGREASRLRQLDESIEKMMRERGLGANDDDLDTDDEQQSGSGTRWLRMLGINRNTDDEE